MNFTYFFKYFFYSIKLSSVHWLFFRNLADPHPLIRGCRSAWLRKTFKIGLSRLVYCIVYENTFLLLQLYWLWCYLLYNCVNQTFDAHRWCVQCKIHFGCEKPQINKVTMNVLIIKNEHLFSLPLPPNLEIEEKCCLMWRR